MSEQWYYVNNGQQHGPVTPEELRGLATSGHLRPTDLVWREGLKDWAQADAVHGLFPQAASTPLTEPGAAASLPGNASIGSSQPAPKRPARSSKWGWLTDKNHTTAKVAGGVIFILVVVLLCVRLANPPRPPQPHTDVAASPSASTSGSEPQNKNAGAEERKKVAKGNPKVDSGSVHAVPLATEGQESQSKSVTKADVAESESARKPQSEKPSTGKASAVSPQLRGPMGAVLILTFDDDSTRATADGLKVTDVSGQHQPGHGQKVSVAEGRVGKGLATEAGGYVEIPGPFPTGNQPRSLAVWLKQNGPVEGVIHVITLAFRDNHRKNRSFGIMEVGGKGWAFYDNNGGLYPGVDVDSQWHHHCLTFDGSVVKYYFDNRLVGEGSKSFQTSPGPLRIGWNFVGVIDEVVLFDRALSSDEVGNLYQMGCNGISLR